MNFNIRSGSLADLNSIFNIEKTVFLTDSWSIKMIKLEFFKDSSNKTYVFELNGKIIGYAFITAIKFEIHLNRIAIDSNYQQKGCLGAILAYSAATVAVGVACVPNPTTPIACPLAIGLKSLAYFNMIDACNEEEE